jgi:hypothetical protein
MIILEKIEEEMISGTFAHKLLVKFGTVFLIFLLNVIAEFYI